MATVPELDPLAGRRARRAAARQHRARGQGARAGAARRAGGAAGRGPRADRGLPGRRARPRSRARWPGRSRPSTRASSAPPTCCPPTWSGTNVFNQRENRFEFRPGPGVRERRAGRRGQPRVAEDPVGPARVHAGAPRDGRQAHARAGAALPGRRHAEPGRVRGHLPAARRRSSTASWCASRSATRAPPRRATCCSTTPSATACWTSSPVAEVGEVLAAQAAAGAVHGSEALRRYVVAVLDATRADPRVELGASPRAGLMLFRAAKANAALDGRDHALPDDVQALADSVLAHRLLLAPGLGQRGARARGPRRARPRPGAVATMRPARRRGLRVWGCCPRGRHVRRGLAVRARGRADR